MLWIWERPVILPWSRAASTSTSLPGWSTHSTARPARLGVTRQSIIKVWIAERLEHDSTAA